MPDLIILTGITLGRDWSGEIVLKVKNQTSKVIKYAKLYIGGQSIFDSLQASCMNQAMNFGSWQNVMVKWHQDYILFYAEDYQAGQATTNYRLYINPGETRSIRLLANVKPDAIVGTHYLPAEWIYQME